MANDGGPAFPTTPVNYGYRQECSGDGYPAGQGLSLRDYFAGKAMQAMATTLCTESEIPGRDISEIAYSLADCMMEAREK